MAKSNSKDTRKKFEGIKCVTPTFRASYLTVFEPKSYEQGPPKYSVEMLFDKKTSDLTDMKKKMGEIAVKAWGKDKAQWPKNFRWPFKDGDNMGDDIEEAAAEIYAGNYVARTDSQNEVTIIDQKKNDILNKNEIFSGCFCRASLYMVPYENIGGKGPEGRSGIKLYFQGIQLVKKGEPFGNVGAKNDFDEVEDEGGGESESEGDDFNLGF